MRTDAQTGWGAGQTGKGGRTGSCGKARCSSMPSYAPSSTSCVGSETRS